MLRVDVVPECEKSSATTYYWYREALDISDSISEGGGLNWRMTVCLLIAWLMVCLAMIKGIKSSGKVRDKEQCSQMKTSVVGTFMVQHVRMTSTHSGSNKHRSKPGVSILIQTNPNLNPHWPFLNKIVQP